MNTSNIELDWAEAIVVFNSLIKNIERLREILDSDSLDDDELYDAEEELNDYVLLITRLRERYNQLSDKGELSAQLSKKLKAIC